jgi:uncharacterized protein (DUF1499 family)
MASERAERVTVLEAAFRIANERMAAWAERHEDGRTESYYCECADRGCRGRVVLSREEYEAVRSNPKRFFVINGHVVEDLESVVESHPGYLVIEKPDDVLALVLQTDPRSEERGAASDAAEETAAEIAAEEA